MVQNFGAVIYFYFFREINTNIILINPSIQQGFKVIKSKSKDMYNVNITLLHITYIIFINMTQHNCSTSIIIRNVS